MKKTWYNSLANWIYRRAGWPMIFAYWCPLGNETLPPRIGVSINGESHWYSIETKEQAQ